MSEKDERIEHDEEQDDVEAHKTHHRLENEEGGSEDESSDDFEAHRSQSRR